MKTLRVVGYDYDYHIFNVLGKRISSGSGQDDNVASAFKRCEEEFKKDEGATISIVISTVREIKE